MFRPTRRLLLLAALLLLSVPPPAHAGGDLVWRRWDQGLREAEETGRPVLVDVYTDWCRWCRVMDREVYARQEIRDYVSRRFVPVRLDAESVDPVRYQSRRYTERSLATALRVTGYPTTVFLGSRGERLINVPGYHPAERFRLLLEYVADGHLERGTSFEAFERRAGERRTGR